MSKPNHLHAAIVLALTLVLAGPVSAEPGDSHLGVYLQELDDGLRQHFRYKGDGVLIVGVIDDTGAEKAGLEEEDIITTIDGKKVSTIDEVKSAVRRKRPGERAEMSILRDEEATTVVVEITEKRGQATWNSPRKWVYFPPDERPWVGVHMEDLNTQLADYFKVKSGILLKEVLKGSPAEEAGLRAGDIVISWEEKKIKDTEDFFRQLDRSDPGDRIRLTIVRKGKKKKLKITLGEPKDGDSSVYGFHPGRDFHRGPSFRYRGPAIKRPPLPYFEYPIFKFPDGRDAFEHAESRLNVLAEQIKALTAEVRRLAEKLGEKGSDRAGD